MMNEEDKERLLKALMEAANKQNQHDEKHFLSFDMINDFIRSADLGIEEASSESDPFRILFNVIVGMQAKVSELEDEVRYLKNHVEHDGEPIHIKFGDFDG